MLPIELMPGSMTEMSSPGAMPNGPNGNFAGDLENAMQHTTSQATQHTETPKTDTGPGDEISAPPPDDGNEAPISEEGATWQALLMTRIHLPDKAVPAEPEIAIDALPPLVEGMENPEMPEPEMALPEEIPPDTSLEMPLPEELENTVAKDIPLKEPLPEISPTPKEAPPEMNLEQKPVAQTKTEEIPPDPLIAQAKQTEEPEKPKDNILPEKAPVTIEKNDSAGILEGVENPKDTMDGNIRDLLQNDLLQGVDVTAKAPEAPQMEQEPVIIPQMQKSPALEAEAHLPEEEMVEIDTDFLENTRTSKSIFTAQGEPTEEVPTDAVLHLPEKQQAESETDSDDMFGDSGDKKQQTLTEPSEALQRPFFQLMERVEQVEQPQTLELRTFAKDIAPTDQIIKAAEVALDEGKQEIKLKLAPASLGNVHITLTNESGGMTAKIMAESPETQKLLASQLYQLEDQLKVRGIEIVDMEVSYMPDLTQQESQGNWEMNKRNHQAIRGLSRVKMAMGSYDFSLDHEVSRVATQSLRDTSSVEFSA